MSNKEVMEMQIDLNVRPLVLSSHNMKLRAAFLEE